MAKGFLQKQEIDYGEFFSVVARQETIKTMIALAYYKILSLFHLDVKSTFLNGPLEEEVFIVQPPGIVIKGKENLVFKLPKALYSLKQVQEHGI